MTRAARNDRSQTLRLLRQLYRRVDGFDIPRAQERLIERTRSSSTYGEIMPSATLQLIEALDLQPHDTFVDLGSGVGKVVLAAALASKVGTAIGVELAPDRHTAATRVLEVAVDLGLVDSDVVKLRAEDILRTNLDEATVIYTCSTAFPTAFTHRIARRVADMGRPLTFVSLQELDELPHFEPERVLRLDMSWSRKHKVHVYAVRRPARGG